MMVRSVLHMLAFTSEVDVMLELFERAVADHEGRCCIALRFALVHRKYVA